VSEERNLLDVCRRAAERARARGADQAEIFATWSLESKVNLEADDIGTAVCNEEEKFGIRVRAHGATGFAATNDRSPDALDASIEVALELAKVSPPDPHGDLPEPRAIEPVEGLCDPQLEGLSVEAVGKLAGQLAARTRGLDSRIRLDSGWVAASVAISAVASSTGVEGVERTTDADALLFGMAVDGDTVGSFDLEQVSVCGLGELHRELEATPERFAERVLRALGAGRGETFKGTLVVSPDAVAEFLLPPLVGAISSHAVRTGKSRLAGRIGERVFSESFNLVDDGTLPGRPGSSSFDREGMPHHPLALIENGTLRSYLFNTHEARALGRSEGSTGHAAGGPGGPPAVGPSNLLVGAGTLDDETLVLEVERGILLRRFSGNTDPVSGDFSGVAKGSSLLRRGSDPRPVQETLISGNLYELLGAVSGIGRSARWIGGSVCAPLIRLEGVSVTAG
jgi:PmbA protein